MTATMTITAPPTAGFRWWARADVLAATVIVTATLALRSGQFGNPLAGIDEQFYLLVGDRMWSGTVPYVDIWDRKPVGLFLLFAAIRALPGDGILAAHAVAACFVAATAWCVALLARRSVGWGPATMAAVLYVAGLNQMWGETTQSPVFYNLPVAIAALLTLRATACPGEARRLGLISMLLCGVAVQVKTNAVFQGAFFACWLLISDWRRTRSVLMTLRLAIELAAMGALPTLAAMASYAAMGQFPAWWQANVLSVLAKGRPTDQFATDTFVESFCIFVPVTLLALVGLRLRTARFTRLDAETGFLLGWAAAGVADFTSIGGYFPHYGIPLLLACCPIAATAFAVRRWGTGLMALVMVWPVVQATWLNPRIAAKQRGIAAEVLAALPADVRTRCLFIYEGPPIYFHLAHACTVSRFVFSAHLSSAREAPSLGVNPAAALRAAIAREPGTVLTVAHSKWTDRNYAQEKVLAAELRAHYVPVRLLPYTASAVHGDLVLWRRR